MNDVVTGKTDVSEEIDFKAVREEQRKCTVEVMTEAFADFETNRQSAFADHKNCVVQLAKMSASTQCAGVKKNYADQWDETDGKLKVTENARDTLRQNCYPSVDGMYKLGQDYMDMQEMKFFNDQYEGMKSELMGYKNAMTSARECGGSENCLNQFMKKFNELYPKTMEKDTEWAAKWDEQLTNSKAWEVNFAKPENCEDMENCPYVDQLFQNDGDFDEARD